MNNNDYIQNASDFLDNLLKELDIELFLQQYQSLDHESLSHSIPLGDKRIGTYYDFCLQRARKTESKNFENYAICISNENKSNLNDWWFGDLSKVNPSHFGLTNNEDLKLSTKFQFVISYKSHNKNHDLFDFFIKEFTGSFNSKTIVNKVENDTFDDSASNIAA